MTRVDPRAVRGLLNLSDPLDGNPDAQYWRDQALTAKRLLQKALTCDLQTRKALRDEHAVPPLEQVVSNLGFSALYNPFDTGHGKPVRKAGRPRRSSGGLLDMFAPPKSRIKKKPGAKQKWTPEFRSNLVQSVERLRQEHVKHGRKAPPAKEILEELVELQWGRKPTATTRREFNRQVRVLQTQLSKGRREGQR